jgi:hypothetical protein
MTAPNGAVRVRTRTHTRKENDEAPCTQTFLKKCSENSSAKYIAAKIRTRDTYLFEDTPAAMKVATVMLRIK